MTGMGLVAYEVFYNIPSTSGSITVLAKADEEIGKAVERKVKGFSIGDKYSSIERAKEVSLSQVKISDLSITEYVMLNLAMKNIIDLTN